MLAAPAAYLGLCALRAPRALRALSAVAFLAGIVVVASAPDADDRSLADGAPDSIAYLMVATGTWATIAWVLLVLLRRFVRHQRTCAARGVVSLPPLRLLPAVVGPLGLRDGARLPGAPVHLPRRQGRPREAASTRRSWRG